MNLREGPKVYVVKEQMRREPVGSVPMDYADAAKYGELEFITQIDMPMHPNSPAQEFWNREVNRFVQHYRPEIDYVVPTGQPMSIMTVGFMLGQVNKVPRYLVWRREENRYRLVEFRNPLPDVAPEAA